MKSAEMGIKGHIIRYDAEDAEFIESRAWQLKRGHKGHGWYARTTLRIGNERRTVAMHRLLMSAKTGQCVDHINGDSLDNRKSNLRFVTHRQNMQNRRKGLATSQYKGVCWHQGKCRWVAQIQVNGQKKHLGWFKDEAAAAKAYDAAARGVGRHCTLNFPKKGEASAIKRAS